MLTLVLVLRLKSVGIAVRMVVNYAVADAAVNDAVDTVDDGHYVCYGCYVHPVDFSPHLPWCLLDTKWLVRETRHEVVTSVEPSYPPLYV